MKKLLPFILFSLFSGITSAQKIIRDPNAEPRQVSGFTALEISGPFNIRIIQSETEGLAVSAEEKESIAGIKTEIRNGVLRIWYEPQKKLEKNRGLKAYISVKQLDRIKSSGACDIRIEGTLASRDLDLVLSGACDLQGKLAVANRLGINLSGASDITISGNAGHAEIRLSGASDIKGYEMNVRSCNISASGASDVQISVDRELSVDLSGASSVSYRGSPELKQVRTTTGSSVTRKT